MNIIEATKKAMEESKHIARPEFRKCMTIQPTDSSAGYILCDVNDCARCVKWWNPHPADIVAKDWEVVEVP